MYPAAASPADCAVASSSRRYGARRAARISSSRVRQFRMGVQLLFWLQVVHRSAVGCPVNRPYSSTVTPITASHPCFSIGAGAARAASIISPKAFFASGADMDFTAESNGDPWRKYRQNVSFHQAPSTSRPRLDRRERPERGDAAPQRQRGESTGQALRAV